MLLPLKLKINNQIQYSVKKKKKAITLYENLF